MMARWLVLFLCSQSSGSFGSRKAGRGLAMKLHPHLIAFGEYIGTEGSKATEENRGKREEMEGQGQGARV